jgi:hypothetical protein
MKKPQPRAANDPRTADASRRAGVAEAPNPADLHQAGDANEAFAERARKRREEDAKRATDTAKEEGRLPESGTVTNPAPATAADMSPGGAFLEPDVRKGVSVDHPSVDNNPRAGTSAVQNGTDWNDPHRRTPDDPKFTGQGLDLSVYGKDAEKK